MTTCLGKSCSFGLLCVSFMNVLKFVFVLHSLCFEGCMLDVIELIATHSFSIYFST